MENSSRLANYGDEKKFNITIYISIKFCMDIPFQQYLITNFTKVASCKRIG